MNRKEKLLTRSLCRSVKITKETSKYTTIDLDIFHLGYQLKPSTADKIEKLFYLYADNTKNSTFETNRKTVGIYVLPKNNADRFIIELRTLFDDLNSVEAESENSQTSDNPTTPKELPKRF